MFPEEDSAQTPTAGADVTALAARVAALEEQVMALQRARVPAPVETPAPAGGGPSVQPPSAPPTEAPRTVGTVLFSAPSIRANLPPLRSKPRVHAVASPPLSPAGDARSLEELLGSNVLGKIAVLLLLAGAAWFLKWAYENAWIGPLGRVLTGLAAGAGLILWSERFRRRGTVSFSYALKAVGSGVLYLSIWASLQLYHEVPASLALLLMLAVTAWNITLALTQNARLLAGYALLGAYLTPALLSTGGDHQVFLFVYLTMIAAGVLALLRVRPWNALLLAPLPASAAFYIAWYVEHFSHALFTRTLLLGLLLWAVLAAIPLVAVEFTGFLAGVLQPVGAALFGALTVYSVLADSNHHDAEPWAALAFAAAYLAMSRRRRGTVIAAIHLSLALTFVTVAIPLKLSGHGITVGWLAESLAVFSIAQLPALDERARHGLQWLGLAAMLLGTGGALLHLGFALRGPAFFNRDFATAAGALVVLAAAAWLFRSAAADDRAATLPHAIAPLAVVLFNILLLVALERQLSLAFTSAAADFAFSAAMALQAALMVALGFWQRVALVRWIGLLLFAATIVKVVLYDLRNMGTGYRVVSYLALGALLLGVSYAYQNDWLGLREPPSREGERPAEEHTT